MLSLSSILGMIKLAGSELPAFKALFEHVTGSFSAKDQDTLQKAYAHEMAKSDQLHSDVQNALK